MEREERNQQREHDRIQQDKQREEQDKQRESEKEQRQYRKKDEKDREFEIERMKFERDKMDFELQMKAASMKKASSEVDEDEEGEDNKEGSVASNHTRRRIGAKGPRMPCFDERSHDMDSFLHRFEVYAESQGRSKGQWAVYLSALLKGKALEVYSRLPVKDAQDYETLKDALLKRFNLTEEGFKQNFNLLEVKLVRHLLSLLPGWRIYLIRWIDLANVEKDSDGLMNLIVRERFLESCPVQLAIFLRAVTSSFSSSLVGFALLLRHESANRLPEPTSPTVLFAAPLLLFGIH